MLAEQLGKLYEQRMWKERADEMLKKMIEFFGMVKGLLHV